MTRNFVNQLLQSGSQIEMLGIGLLLIAIGLFLVVVEMARSNRER